MSKNKTTIFALVFLSVITWVTFYPSLQNGFTNWDDDRYVTENQEITNLSLAQTKKLFLDTNRGQHQYHPLTMLSFSLEHHFFKLNPFNYHLDNLILHWMNVLLVFWFIYLISKSMNIAVFTALFFAIHPMHVESVAWITERKDVLYTLFYLGALISYCLYCEQKRKGMWAYLFSFILFLASLFSKPAGFTFPFILILLDYFLEGKQGFHYKRLLEKVPFLAVSLIFVWIVTFKISYADIPGTAAYNMIDKIVLWLFVAVVYVGKLFAPVALSNYYPMPEKVAGLLPVYVYLAGAAALFAMALVFRSGRKTRVVLFGFLFFLINISYIIGLFKYEDYLMGERYSYLSYVGLLFVAGYGLNEIMQRNKARKVLAQVSVLTVAIIFSVISWQRCHVWKDGYTLWSDMISKFPNLPVGYSNRGHVLAKEKKWEEAVSDFNTSIDKDPKHYQAYVNRGVAYEELGQPQKALNDYSTAIKLNFDYRAFLNRGLLHYKLGYEKQAIDDITSAIQLRPHDAEIITRRGSLYFQKRQYKEALNDFSLALKINPQSIVTYFKRGALYQHTKQYDLAILDFSQVISFRPDYANAYLHRAVSYKAVGEFQKALNDLLKLKSFGYDVNESDVRELKLALEQK